MKDIKNKREILDEVQQDLINDLGQYVESLGGKTLLGRIWGLLLSSAEPVSLKDMTKKLHVSKPAISATVNIGLQFGVFIKVYNPKYPRESFIKLNVDSMEMLIRPGIKKLSVLYTKFNKALEELQTCSATKSDDKEFDIVEKRLDYMTLAFSIFLEEYEKMAKIVIEKIKPMEDELKKEGIL